MKPPNVVESWIVNPKLSKSDFEGKQPPVDNGHARLDPARYHSEAFMALEWERLWTRVWLIAGVESDIPEPGDYLLYRIRHEEIICVRQADGSVKAMYNVCPHRGNRVVFGERGSLQRFTCAFHSWQYDLDGSLIRIQDQDTFKPEVVAHGPRMTPVRCETKAGLVFINMDDEAPPLAERIGLPDGYLEQYRMDRMHVVRHVVAEWGANWKNGVDAFYETYHLHAIHPQTQGVMADIGTQYDLYPHGCQRMIVPIGRKSPRVPDQDGVDESLRYMMASEGMDADAFQGTAADVRAAIAQHKRRRAKTLGFDYDHFTDGQLTDSWATGVFPNVQIGMHPEGCFLMRFMPHPTNPQRFFYDAMTLFRPADDPNYKAPDWMGVPDGTDLTGASRPDTEHVPFGGEANLGEVLDQDVQLLNDVQVGTRSRGFRGCLWGEQEQRLRHYQREVDRYVNGEK
ncbi:MAG: aromatic ring-hydroxylating dioxygenase subunit alpha [Gammaproteobacteria bacterium]|nr:aromatic ring-hydroxylating dioxygenase subunit alpha [Gammaproteobacteria bacterium]MXY06797.1 aromatic ring-hydroxylating dioxygenase subunit alpha [Gammaproteobacteria bacterium]MYE51034.1 aromatic ring-hydroxylating dioxygenase subunit alpha [Gammaproteobacteria bacterium]MYG12175.1 aromatic ring-hydroxylating dioxygenase subunit alpha [Gammaproteobacteria bacterium]MYK28268.1 aromatic ring-hydroxylating dioxygenase subunit alpha [Gammaproteobacteria bacterium]